MMDPHHQYVFIVGTIEDRDSALGESVRMHPPEEVMLQIESCRLFERRYDRARGFIALVT